MARGPVAAATAVAVATAGGPAAVAAVVRAAAARAEHTRVDGLCTLSPRSRAHRRAVACSPGCPGRDLLPSSTMPPRPGSSASLARVAAPLLAIAAALTACKGAPPEATTCTCTPGNRAIIKAADGTPLDSNALLAQLRLHRREVEAHRTPRDIKVLDDQLRFALVSFCQPCGDWVQDRMTIEELFPLARLDDAAGACR
jgi:hypothetical protein